MGYKDPLDPANIEKMRAAKRKHYHENKEQYRERFNRNLIAKRDYIRSLKESTPCLDCKKNYPFYVMQFDHVRGVKTGNIARIYQRLGQKALDEEIAKCDIVCGNCHAERTWSRYLETKEEDLGV